jgi:hypothetical protein
LSSFHQIELTVVDVILLQKLSPHFVVVVLIVAKVVRVEVAEVAEVAEVGSLLINHIQNRKRD